MRQERIGNQTLILADCREVLEDLTADCFLTDAPYGIAGTVDAQKKGAYTSPFDDTREHLLEVVVPAIVTCISVTQRGAITPGNNNMRIYPEPADIGCFWTPAGTGFSKWGFTTYHPIYYYGTDFRAGHGPWPTGKQVTERAMKNGHPCPKPLEAWKWLLEKVSQEGETVIDPFVGSGTTLVACQQLGRHGIGIEICEEYFEIACKRVERAARGLVDQPMVAPPVDDRQTALFADEVPA